jgi:hypothetical protein
MSSKSTYSNENYLEKSLNFEKNKDKYLRNSLGMWKIENEDYKKGGEIKWEDKIRFRS